jgi:hypothetical protein
MRWATGIFLLVATALPGIAQVASEKAKQPDYFPLSVGTKWTYEVNGGPGRKTLVTNQITKMETIGGKTLARLEAVVNGKVIGTEHLSSTPEGVFRHRLNADELNPPVCILKYPIREGDRWIMNTTHGSQQLKLAFQSKEMKTLTLPSGNYTAIPVVVESSVNGTYITATSWYAPEIGLVQEFKDVGGNTTNLQLVKFEPGK